MKTSVPVNINDIVTATLTLAGARVHSRYEMKHVMSKYHQLLTEGSVIEIPLWEFMQIFGPDLYHGMVETLFQQNSIKIKLDLPT